MAVSMGIDVIEDQTGPRAAGRAQFSGIAHGCDIFNRTNATDDVNSITIYDTSTSLPWCSLGAYSTFKHYVYLRHGNSQCEYSFIAEHDCIPVPLSADANVDVMV